MPETTITPAQKPPRAFHPDQPLPTQSTVQVLGDGTLLVAVAVEKPCCC